MVIFQKQKEQVFFDDNTPLNLSGRAERECIVDDER